MKITNENIRDIAKGDTVTRTRVETQYIKGFGDRVQSLPVLEVTTYTVKSVRKFKDGRTRVLVSSDRGYNCTLAFPCDIVLEKV